MNAGIAAYVILTQNTDVTDIVGVKVFPEVAEQETATPFIVYQLQSVAPEDTHDGPSKLDEVRFEFLCYADTYALAADLGDKVRGALDRVSGTYNGVNVESVQFNDVDIDTIDAPRRFAQVLTFTFRIKRDDFTIAQGTPVTGAKIGDLYDVDVSGVTDGQVLAYDASVQEWQPADDAGGVTELGQLTDVQFGQGGPETGELLKYDGSEWTNDSIVKSEVGLGNVDNTSDAAKPVSTATQTALSAKANSADFSNVDNTSDADKPVSTATQTALNAKADTSAVPTDLNDLSDVTIVGTPAGNQALIYDATAGAFKSLVSYTNRFEDEVETGLQMPSVYFERGYSVKSEGDGIFIDASPDTPTAGKVIKRKIYHKTGFISDDDVIGDYTLIHTFADDTAYADTVAVFDAFEDGATYGVPPFTLAQSWEEVTAAPAFTGLLNETYGSGAEAAYSTRRLNGNVTDCMVIRRASDSTTTTIGFDGSGNISEADIISFCTGTTCTVYQWLDQSGNGNTATAQSGQEPTIYTGGAIVKDNGKAMITADATEEAFDIPITSTDAYKIFSVMQSHAPHVFLGSENANDFFLIAVDGNNSSGSGAGFTLSSSRLDGNSYTIGTRNNLYDDFSMRRLFYADIDLNFQGSTVQNSYGGNSTYRMYNSQELIFYPASSTNPIASIESNIGDYFTQNTPLLDTYSGAAACYSLRLMRTAYTGDAVEVYNGSSYADIGFNVFGELDTVALAAHCGSNDGFVSKWYDQAGSNDLTQTTTGQMPKIYDGTDGVETENGKPVLRKVTTNASMRSAYDITTGGDRTVIMNHTRPINSFATNATTWIGNRNTDNFFASAQSSPNYPILDNVTINSAHKNGSSWSYPTTRTDLWTDINGQNLYFIDADFSFGTTGFCLGFQDGSFNYAMMDTQEIIIYTSDQSSNRTNIESNINTFYDIF